MNLYENIKNNLNESASPAKKQQIGMSDDDTEKIFNAIIDTVEKLGYQDCNFYIGDPDLGNSGTINLDNNYFIKVNSWPYPADVFISLVEKYDKDKPNLLMGKDIIEYSIKEIANIDGSYNKDIDTEVIPEVNELLTKIINEYKNINKAGE